METLKEKIFTNWPSRLIRLVMAVMMLIWGIKTGEWSLWLFSGLLLFMAISNTGCCGTQGCAVTPTKDIDQKK